MTLPKAFYISAHKAGAATLAETFKRHVRVFIPPLRETQISESAADFRKGPE
jgi:hypothetical protein